jgi:alanine dehydrogenase
VEEAFRQHGLGNVQMPPKMYLDFPEYEGDLRIMPVERLGLDISGVKVVNVHPNNSKYGLPTVTATITLNSTKTGQPIAFMEAGLITNLRTGAAGGVAAKYLSRKDSSVVGLVGLGNQARTQLEALVLVRNIETVKIYDKSFAAEASFKNWVKKKLGIKVVMAGNLEETCNCDILVTTTPVRKPIIKAEWIKPGTHINAIGADAMGKQELDPKILEWAKIVVDDYEQASHSGEINVPISSNEIGFGVNDIYATLGEIVCGESFGRGYTDEITVFDSTGLAIQDLSTAVLVYQKAVEQSIGLKLSLF